MGFEDISESHRSQVWKYFWRGYGNDKDFSKCQLCDSIFSSVYMSTCSLKFHLESRHNITIPKGPKVYIS